MKTDFQFYGFDTKVAAKEYLREYLKPIEKDQEFRSFVLSTLFYKRHYWCSKHRLLPTKFKKVKWEQNDYQFRNNDRLLAYFPVLGEWLNPSIIKSVDGINDIERSINTVLRDAANPFVRDYKYSHSKCERCGKKATEIDHVSPEFIEIQKEARKLITDEEVEAWENRKMAAERWEFEIPVEHPAVQYVIKAHETAVLMAVCGPCHLQNAKDRKEGKAVEPAPVEVIPPPAPFLPKLTKDSYPLITRYRYHFAAIYYSTTQAALTEAGECIGKTVPTDHPEFALLVEAGRQKRQELENIKAAEK